MLAGHAFALSVMMYSLPSHVLYAANILLPSHFAMRLSSLSLSHRSPQSSLLNLFSASLTSSSNKVLREIALYTHSVMYKLCCLMCRSPSFLVKALSHMRQEISRAFVESKKRHKAGIVLPSLCRSSVIRFRVCGLTGYGIEAAPGPALHGVELPLLFLRELLVGYEFFHMLSPLLKCPSDIIAKRSRDVKSHYLPSSILLCFSSYCSMQSRMRIRIWLLAERPS